jgi:hypothetical protein
MILDDDPLEGCPGGSLSTKNAPLSGHVADPTGFVIARAGHGCRENLCIGTKGVPKLLIVGDSAVRLLIQFVSGSAIRQLIRWEAQFGRNVIP